MLESASQDFSTGMLLPGQTPGTPVEDEEEETEATTPQYWTGLLRPGQIPGMIESTEEAESTEVTETTEITESAASPSTGPARRRARRLAN